MDIFTDRKPVQENILSELQYDWCSEGGLQSALGSEEHKQRSPQAKSMKRRNGIWLAEQAEARLTWAT